MTLINCVIFDSKITFEKHLSSVSRAAYQRLGILRKSWRVFHDISSWEMLSELVLPDLDYCRAVWCSTADTHLKLLDRAVSGARFLTHGALVAHWYTYAPPGCRTSQYRMTFIHLSVSL